MKVLLELFFDTIFIYFDIEDFNIFDILIIFKDRFFKK